MPTYLYEVDRGAYHSKEQEKKHFKELDRKELLDRESTYLYEVDRGAYHSKEQKGRHLPLRDRAVRPSRSSPGPAHGLEARPGTGHWGNLENGNY